MAGRIKHPMVAIEWEREGAIATTMGWFIGDKDDPVLQIAGTLEARTETDYVASAITEIPKDAVRRMIQPIVEIEGWPASAR